MPTPPGDAGAPDPTQIARERDLYRKLLDLGARDEIEPLLREALALIVDLAGARRGYLEIQDERERDALAAPRFWMASGCTEGDVDEIRAAFSQGVIAEAIATRQTIVTASALQDPRFRDRRSVKKHRIEAVLCAPLGGDAPSGVLYLQGRLLRGPFTEDDRLHAETFARHVSALADRLLIRRRRSAEADPTQPLRAVLQASAIVGRSTALARVLREVAMVAPRDVTVLLTGASGTGKTQLARLIHDNGPRAAGPFVELNCAAIPEALLESELFGAAAGAHSAATRKVDGKIAAAEGGTLFLDEVGELAPVAQAKVLQLLQSKEYFPLGSTRAQKADVRLIAATNADLKAAVARREFREDLLYRLHVLPVRVPSLAERREDIPELAAYFCARAVSAHGLAQNLDVPRGAASCRGGAVAWQRPRARSRGDRGGAPRGRSRAAPDREGAPVSHQRRGCPCRLEQRPGRVAHVPGGDEAISEAAGRAGHRGHQLERHRGRQSPQSDARPRLQPDPGLRPGTAALTASTPASAASA